MVLELTVSAVAVSPHLANASQLRLPSEQDYQRFTINPSKNGLVFSSPDARAASAPSGASLGPIRAESEVIGGRRHMHYRIDGLHFLGGDVGGSIGGRGTVLTLHWPPSGN